MTNKYFKISLYIVLLLCLAITGNKVFQLATNSNLEERPEKIIYPDRSIKDGEVMVYKFAAHEIIMVSFLGSFDFIYDPSQSLSVKNVVTKLNYRYMINGSFFEQSKEHAGWLSILGQTKTPQKKDRQLSHIIRFKPNTGEMNFIEYKLFKPSMNNNYIEFQSGPLMIEKNQVSKNYIQKSLNGLLPYRRTLLAYTEEDRRKYFIVTKKTIKLDELTKYLLALSVFSGKTLYVINLDGGPSVALYSKTYPELSFNETAILPVLLGVR